MTTAEVRQVVASRTGRYDRGEDERHPGSPADEVRNAFDAVDWSRQRAFSEMAGNTGTWTGGSRGSKITMTRRSPEVSSTGTGLNCCQATYPNGVDLLPGSSRRNAAGTTVSSSATSLSARHPDDASIRSWQR